MTSDCLFCRIAAGEIPATVVHETDTTLAFRDITPPPGAQMPGGFTKRVGTGAREKLLAVACVVYDGTTAAALVGIAVI